GHCLCYQNLGVSTARKRSDHVSIPAQHGIKVEESITILKSPEELYRCWRDLENLPCFMQHLESVRPMGGNQSHWVAKGPMGSHVEWDAEVLTERENEVIGWRSLEGSAVDTAGSVHFTRAPGNRG